MNRNTNIGEVSKIMMKSDCLTPHNNQYSVSEVRKVNLHNLESLPLFSTFLPENLTSYAKDRVRYLTAKGFKNHKVTDHNKTTDTYLIERKTECFDTEEVQTEP